MGLCAPVLAMSRSRARICEEFTNFNRSPALLRALPHRIEKHMTVQDYSDDDIRQLLQRVMAEQAAIARSDDRSIEGDVVIVSHGGPLRVLLCSMLGMPLERQWQIRLDPGSLSAIDLLPIHEPWTPQAILALLNVHGSTGAAKGARTEATSESLREEGAT